MVNLPITDPHQLKSLSLDELRFLAEEIRNQIISVSIKNGGHLGASLGAVEIAIALHFSFDSPRDSIVWDVGHQAYAHKLLTGRWNEFKSLRQTHGLAPFLRRDESVHDVFGAGHSSTSLSAALGIAWASRNENKWTIAVIGDGALTAGLSFEALNNFHSTETGPLLVILNDNHLSISENVGAVPNILSSEKAKDYFELFGMDYMGPIDGHDLNLLLSTLKNIRERLFERPILLHVLTQKGKGYPPAEESPVNFHGISATPVQLETSSHPVRKTYSQAFGEEICKLSEMNERIVCITAAMSDGTGLIPFSLQYPNRFFDVGIAEGHAVTFAAGLATQGLKPVVAIYSTFLQRALDSLIHDVALQNLNVTLMVDRAGLVGQDGPTHHGAFDLAYLGMIPGFQIAAPSCCDDLKVLLRLAMDSSGPWAIRYARGAGPEKLKSELIDGVRIHQEVKQPRVIAIGLGSAATRLVDAIREVENSTEWVSVYSTVMVKPVSQFLLKVIQKFPQARVLCVEDGVIRGGFGESLLAASKASLKQFCLIGYPDEFMSHGTLSDLESEAGVSKAELVRKAAELLESEK